MEALRIIDTTHKSSASPEFRCEIIDKYRSALERSVAVIKEINPDMILALSRKGPRLVEILQSYGLYEINIPVITEKALDFIEKKELEGKRLIVFDDIVVSGSTVSSTTDIILGQFGCEVKFASVAIDRDTIALRDSGDGQYPIKTGKGHEIPVQYAVPLNLAERYDFCSSIVRSLVVLNKPYDVDFPILYTNVKSKPGSWHLAPPDKHFDVTTIAQLDQGYRRSSIMDPSDNQSKAFISALFGNEYFLPGICKTRVYQNTEDGTTAIVPIVTFKAKKDILLNGEFFCKELSSLNELVAQISKKIPPSKRPEAIYRLTTFLASYIYGNVFFTRNEQIFGRNTESGRQISLSTQDLHYLFGQDSAQIIINHLANSHEEIIAFSNAFLKSSEANNFVATDKPGQSMAEPLFDSPRQELLNIIKKRVIDRLSSHDPITSQIATIFEAIHCLVELPAQEKAREMGLNENTISRLKVGFSYEQLREMAYNFGILKKNDSNGETLLSLSVDMLVDDGIQIPIFYFGENGYYERVYRHGETALNDKQFAYAIAKSFKSIFEELKAKYDKDYLRRISCEKFGVICVEELKRSGHLSALAWKLGNPIEEKLSQGFRYLRHGKVLRLTYSANEDAEQFPLMFNQWGVQKGVFTEPPVGIKYNPQFLKILESDVGHEPILETVETISKLAGVASLLLQIDMELDKENKSEYLIALTACADAESYLWALREELVIVFDRSKTDLQTSLSMLKNYLENPMGYPKEKAERLKDRLGQAHSAANGIFHKSQLRFRFHEFVEDIEKHFMASEARDKALYNLTLGIYIKDQKFSRDFPLSSAIRDEMQRIENFGSISTVFLSILRNTRTLVDDICSLRLTASGKPDGRHVRKIKNDYDSLNNEVNKWNTLIEEQLSQGLTDCIALKLIRFSDLPDFYFKEFNVKEIKQLSEILFTNLNSNFSLLYQYHLDRYSQEKWDVLIPRLRRTISITENKHTGTSGDDQSTDTQSGNTLITKNGIEQEVSDWELAEIMDTDKRDYAIILDDLAFRCWVFGEEVELTPIPRSIISCFAESKSGNTITFEKIMGRVLEYRDEYKRTIEEYGDLSSIKKRLQAQMEKVIYNLGPPEKKLRSVIIPNPGLGYKINLNENEKLLYIHGKE